MKGLKVGTEIITIRNSSCWNVGERATITIVDKGCSRALFHSQNGEEWWIREKDFIIFSSKPLIVVACKKYQNDATQKYIGQEITLLAHGNGTRVCECKDGNILTFSEDELKIEEKK